MLSQIRNARWAYAGLLCVGLLTGFLSGFFGVGGGTVIVPALVWFGLSQRSATATSLAAIIPASISGVIAYTAEQEVDWIAAFLLAAGMILGSQLGSWLLSKLSELFLRWFYVFFLLCMVVFQLALTPERHTSVHLSPLLALLLVVIGVCIGTLSGLLGIGGGALAVPALSFLVGTGDLLARGTSLLAMFPGSLAGTFANWRRNLVHFNEALIVGVTAACVAPVGTLCAAAVSPWLGAHLFALYLLLLCLRSIWVALLVTPAFLQRFRPSQAEQDSPDITPE